VGITTAALCYARGRACVRQSIDPTVDRVNHSLRHAGRVPNEYSNRGAASADGSVLSRRRVCSGAEARRATHAPRDIPDARAVGEQAMVADAPHPRGATWMRERWMNSRIARVMILHRSRPGAMVFRVDAVAVGRDQSAFGDEQAAKTTTMRPGVRLRKKRRPERVEIVRWPCLRGSRQHNLQLHPNYQGASLRRMPRSRPMAPRGGTSISHFQPLPGTLRNRIGSG
jgi:hypothetical protein